MPQSYSRDDFLKMQQQAIQRARQMQKKAMPNDEPTGEKIKQAATTEKNESKPNETDKSTFQKSVGKKAIPPPVLKVKSGSQNAIESFLSMDSDTMLILPLLLLLQREGADEMLLMALLYILC